MEQLEYDDTGITEIALGVRATVNIPKPRIKVPASSRLLALGVPDNANPGDLVVGNRGAAAEVCFDGRCLHLVHVGNYFDGVVRPRTGGRIFDRTGWSDVRPLRCPICDIKTKPPICGVPECPMRP